MHQEGGNLNHFRMDATLFGAPNAHHTARKFATKAETLVVVQTVLQSSAD